MLVHFIRNHVPSQGSTFLPFCIIFIHHHPFEHSFPKLSYLIAAPLVIKTNWELFELASNRSLLVCKLRRGIVALLLISCKIIQHMKASKASAQYGSNQTLRDASSSKFYVFQKSLVFYFFNFAKIKS
jgi:hypothetical protein